MSFRLGDRVRAGSIRGKLTEIYLHSAIVRLSDGREMTFALTMLEPDAPLSSYNDVRGAGKKARRSAGASNKARSPGQDKT